MILIIFKIILLVVIAYLIGSIPTGYLLVKKLKGLDIREIGSGSTGATNVKRVLGTKWFLVVMLIDALKGYLPVLVAVRWFNFQICYDVTPVLVGAAAIIGHSKSVFLKFTGGKSVATTIGTYIALNPIVGLIVTAIWAVISYATKYISLGSVIAVCLSPLLIIAYYPSEPYIIYAACSAIFVIFMHQDNIKRLISGNENKSRK